MSIFPYGKPHWPLLLASLFLLGCGNGENAHISDRAPSFQLATGLGDSVSSARYQGSVVLIAFWATWCPPCVMEIPMLKSLQQELGPQGLQVIGINLDEEPEHALPPARKRYQFNYPIAIGNAQIVSDFGNFSSLPTAFLIDRQGVIRERFVGIHPQNELQTKIRALLNEPKDSSRKTP